MAMKNVSGQIHINIFIRERNNLMIDWEREEDAFCEGSFKSKFFRNDEKDDELMIGMSSVDWKECAENCVKSFNNLTESQGF